MLECIALCWYPEGWYAARADDMSLLYVKTNIFEKVIHHVGSNSHIITLEHALLHKCMFEKMQDEALFENKLTNLMTTHTSNWRGICHELWFATSSNKQTSPSPLHIVSRWQNVTSNDNYNPWFSRPDSLIVTYLIINFCEICKYQRQKNMALKILNRISL